MRLGCPYLPCAKPWVQPQCHLNQFHGTHMLKIGEQSLHPRPSGTTKKGFLLLSQTCLLLSCLKGRSVPCLSSYVEPSVTGDSDASGKLQLRDITARPHVSLSVTACACASFAPQTKVSSTGNKATECSRQSSALPGQHNSHVHPIQSLV